MPTFASSMLRLLKQVLGTTSRTSGAYAGTPTALDGNTAIAVTEASIGESAGLGASYPADTAALSWRSEQQRLGVNLMGKPLTGCLAEGPRGALAAAIGLSLSGTRTTAFLSGSDLAASQDLLVNAAGQHLPLVIHLVNRALPGQAPALGSGHEAVHLSADSGCFMLFAANVQEAVDFALIARRVAEQTLIPGLVVMDAEHTALAMQEVRLPSGELVEKFLGSPDENIVSPTPTQKLLFGEQRRRVPRMFDADHPVLLGGLQSAEAWGVSKAANRIFFDSHLKEILDESLKQFSEFTGRVHKAVSTYHMEDAPLVLVAQGAAIETVEAAADQVRKNHKIKVGVLGVRTLRPLPSRKISDLLINRQRVCVLERMDAPLADDPPLLRELRAALNQAQKKDSVTNPRFLSVTYGQGGLPLCGSDLINLCIGAEKIQDSHVYLGFNFSRTASSYPKRQVLLDRLHRSYPDIAGLGLDTITQNLPDLRPENSVSLAILRNSGQDGEGLAQEFASLLHRVAGGQLRSRPALFTGPFGEPCIDVITNAPEHLRDPGDQVPVDMILLVSGAASPTLVANLQQGSALLLEGSKSGAELSQETITALCNSRAKLYRIPVFKRATSVGSTQAGLHNDYLAGAVFGVMLAMGKIDINVRRLLANHDKSLAHLHQEQHEARVSTFRKGFEGFKTLVPANLMSTQTSKKVDEAPLVVQSQDYIDDLYDSLPRFWDQVGILYKNEEIAELTPDPYMAVGAIPPLSSALNDLSPLRNSLPALDAADCTGCGACWSYCPDAAIGALVLPPGAVINAGLEHTIGADALRPLTSKLASRVVSLCAKKDFSATTFGEPLNEAFSWLQKKMSPPADRKRILDSAFEKVGDQLKSLPAAVTDPFFTKPNAANKGSGELLFIAINPDACKACGICISVCETGALGSVPQTSRVISDTRKIWQAWEQLPDTSTTSLEPLDDEPSINPVAKLLLSQRGIGSMIGGDGAEPGSGQRLALRLVLSVADSLREAPIRKYIQEIRETRDRLSELIRETLANALPADDLDALARGLADIDTQQTELSAFIDESRNIDNNVDARRLRRLVDLARALRDLECKLSEGRQGFGRAHTGLVLSTGSVTGWAGVFPNNPFRSPVVVDLNGNGAQLAAGLLEGQLRQAVEGIILVRKARLEYEHPEDVIHLGSEYDRLTWRDLSPDERTLCPMMIVAGEANHLTGTGLSEISRLLAGNLPFKLLLLADLDLGLSTHAALDTPLIAVDDSGIDIAMLTLARRNACIAQASTGAPAQLMKSLATALKFQGPALLHVHAPSPARHGFAIEQSIDQARLAIESRTFPLFLYNPEDQGVFGSRFNLYGNLEPLESWTDDKSLTPADWALTEDRFCHCFTPMEDDAQTPMPLADYLLLDNAEQVSRTPFVSRWKNGEQQRLVVNQALVDVCSDRLQTWFTLQELAGLVTPFTARVKQDAEQEVASAHEAEMSALRTEYDIRIANLQDEIREKTRQEVRDRMLALAGYTGSSNDPQQEDN